MTDTTGPRPRLPHRSPALRLACADRQLQLVLRRCRDLAHLGSDDSSRLPASEVAARRSRHAASCRFAPGAATSAVHRPEPTREAPDILTHQQGAGASGVRGFSAGRSLDGEWTPTPSPSRRASGQCTEPAAAALHTTAACASPGSPSRSSLSVVEPTGNAAFCPISARTAKPARHLTDQVPRVAVI